MKPSNDFDSLIMLDRQKDEEIQKDRYKNYRRKSLQVS
jgi:hypothetical protein